MITFIWNHFSSISPSVEFFDLPVPAIHRMKIAQDWIDLVLVTSWNELAEAQEKWYEKVGE